MRRDLRTAFLSMIVFTVLLGLGYPLLITGLAQGIFPGKANGSLIKRDGVVVGSALIGQQFYEPVIGKNGKQDVVKGVAQTQPDPRYFQTRPSGTSPTTTPPPRGFSNLGPNNVTTLGSLPGQHRRPIWRSTGGRTASSTTRRVTKAAEIPVDAADNSASAIDPTSRSPTPGSRPIASPPSAAFR